MEEYKTNGKHVLMDVWNVEFDKLNDLVGLADVMKEGAEIAGATVLHTVMHPFKPNGVTIALVLSESHFTIHTYPEKGFAGIDCYTCGDNVNPINAVNHLLSFLGVDSGEDVNFALVERGEREKMTIGIR